MKSDIRGGGSELRGNELRSGASLRDELHTLIKSWVLDLPAAFDDHTSLLGSGLFDSLALFNLILWIETKTGRTIDPTSVNVAKEWDSIASILTYLKGVTPTHCGDSAPRSQLKVNTPTPSVYKIVKYDSSYKDAVAEFQTGLWSPNAELNLRYLEWKYESNPYTNMPIIYLAFNHNALVGMRGFYGSRWETGVLARQFTVLVADDLLVHENHRNRGLVVRIMQAAFEDLRSSGLEYLFNLSGSKLTVLGSLTMGWRSVGMLRPMGYRSSTATLYHALRRRLSRLPYLWRYAQHRRVYSLTEQNPYTRLDRARTPFAVEAGLAVNIDLRPRPKAMAALVKRIGHDGRLRHVRDETYLDWRFRNPLHEYRFLYIGGEFLDGYLVLKRSGHSHRVHIVDLEAINGHVQAALLKAALTAGRFAELVIWTGTANAELIKQLYAIGFIPIDQELATSGLPCFIARPIHNEHLNDNWCLGNTPLLDLENWDIRMLYSMAG